jgi:hypothetical protein
MHWDKIYSSLSNILFDDGNLMGGVAFTEYISSNHSPVYNGAF